MGCLVVGRGDRHRERIGRGGRGVRVLALLLSSAGAGVLGAQTRLAPSELHPASVLDFMTSAVRLVDVDRDQDLDLVVVNGAWIGWEPVRLYRNDGHGRFELAARALPHLPLPGTSIAVGDLDRDGDPDLVVGSFGFGLRGVENRVLSNDGAGTFTDVTASAMPAFVGQCRHLELSPATRALALCDVDRDGDLDLICANWCQNRLYRNDGSGGFTDETFGALPMDTDASNALAVGDVDGDGDPDLVFGNGQADTVASRANRLYLNDGTGRFHPAPAGALPIHLDETRAVALADLDGDGDLDLAVANAAPPLSLTGAGNRIYVNDGSGRFLDRTVEWLPQPDAPSHALLVEDFDLDGRPDLIFGSGDAAGPAFDRALRNTGTRFVDVSAAWLPRVPDQTFAFASGDLDRDGDPDLVVGNHGPNQLWFNRHRHISGGVARAGGTYPIHVWVEPGELRTPAAALIWIGLQPTWFRVEPFGWAGIDPRPVLQLRLLMVPAPAGTATYLYSVPDAPDLHGLPFCLQALVLPKQNRFTNVWCDVVRER